MTILLRPLSILLFSAAAAAALAAANHTVITDTFNSPWALEFIDRNTLVVTERPGKLWRYDLETHRKTAITGVPAVHDRGQGGLLDVALDPQFADNQQLYLCYSHRGDQGNTTRLMKAMLVADRLQQQQVLFTAQPYFNTNHHYGCRIAFDKAGYLFLTVGDRGERELAQSLTTHNGKVIRLLRNGQVPADNPFVGQADVRAEIYSYGHRNPQGLVYDAQRDRLIEIEHGPRGGDEINIIEPGKNYGWPIITYGREYSGFKVGDGATARPGMVQPLYYYVPSIAPAGADIYTGARFPDYQGDLLIGALKLQHVSHIDLGSDGLSPSESRLFGALKQRVRDVKQGPDDQVYFITDAGWLVRVDRL